jgi:hypothetical protein
MPRRRIGGSVYVEVIMRTLFLLDFIVQWGLGWRYILSPSFRRRVHAGWARQSVGDVAFNVVFCVVAFVVLNGFLVLVGMWLYQGIVAPRLGHGVDR